MLISYNWLQNYFDKKLPAPEEISSLFTNHVFEVESMEEKKGDYVFDVKILPDRAHYLLSHKGIAKELAVLLGVSAKLPVFPKLEINKDINKPLLSVQDAFLCRRYMAVRAENISIKETPEWIKSFLDSIGQKSINPLVDLANFVMFDIGQPMHVFDADKIEGEIIVRRAQEGEKIILLTGETSILQSNDLVIADEKGLLGVAGVKGGRKAEVTKETKNIIIESANFDPVSVRRTSNRLNLRTDASKRFENEITPVYAEEAMAEIKSLIRETFPEAEFGETADFYPDSATSKIREIKFTLSGLSSILGFLPEEKKVVQILDSMGVKVEKEENNFIAIPPPERLDLYIPEDIADEVGRVLGYSEIKAVLPSELDEKIFIDKEFYVTEKIKNFLMDKGYSEVLLYTLSPEGEKEIVHPLAKDKSALRKSLVPKMEEALKLNVYNADLLELDRVKIFEIGHVFDGNGERANLALAVSKGKKKDEKAEEIIKNDFEELEKFLDTSLNLEITNISSGTIGEVSLAETIEKTLDKNFLENLKFVSMPRIKKFQRFSPYPYITRDISLFVPEDTDVHEIKKIIEEEGGEHLKNVRLFDTYANDGKKSLAYRLVFQSMERTLTDGEVNKKTGAICSKIMEINPAWEVR